MNKINSLINGSRRSRSAFSLPVKSMIAAALLLAGIQSPVVAQEAKYTRPSWFFGIAGGANFNFYRGSTQKLDDNFTTINAFHKGQGIGHFLAPVVIEFHPAASRWGFMFMAGSDSRKGAFKSTLTDCNCPTELHTRIRYVTFEPSVRYAPWKNDFYLFAGARVSFNRTHEYTYQLKANPEFPGQVDGPKVNGDISEFKSVLTSSQIGAGYDVYLSSQEKHTQWVLSPFVAFQPYFGQSPRNIETWNITTLRVGAAIKVGRGRLSTPPKEEVVVPVVVVPQVTFAMNSPRNIASQRRVREIFPLRNYIYFNAGSAVIPDRYVLLNKGQVKEFKEDQLEQFAPKNMAGRSSRQMVVYYNVINILGDRLGKNPTANITLVGSSEQGVEDGKLMSEAVKKYLVDVFGISASRIAIEGRDKPKLPSEVVGGTTDLELLSEGKRRVSVESNSPVMLMEFQSGPSAPLKPVEISSVQDAPLDSYVTFNVGAEKNVLSSWSLEIRDDKGQLQNFGPYTKEKVSIPGKSILGTRPEGDFKVTMVSKTKDGQTIKKDTTVHMVLWTASTLEEGTRYSVIFEYDDANVTSIYEKYISDVVTPKIPQGATVIIHGYTDIIGDETYNQKLSDARAAEVKTILSNSLTRAGRSDVKFEVLGFGEDQNMSPFDNKYPEERAYNRTVVIDIIPAGK